MLFLSFVENALQNRGGLGYDRVKIDRYRRLMKLLHLCMIKKGLSHLRRTKVTISIFVENIFQLKYFNLNKLKSAESADFFILCDFLAVLSRSTVLLYGDVWLKTASASN